MFVFGFFFQFLCHMQLINNFFLSILFVALSHCDKQKFCLLHWITNIQKNCSSHWVTGTNKICICCQKVAKSVNNTQLFGKFEVFLALFRTFMPYFAFFCGHFRALYYFFVVVFWNFLVTYTNFVCRSDSVRQAKITFVAVAQCNKQKICFFCSDSVRQTILK